MTMIPAGWAPAWRTASRSPWPTRTQGLRTLSELPFGVDLGGAVPIQVFQRIAEHFGVDGHTAGKAVRWFHREP